VSSATAISFALNQGDVMILLGALSWSAYIFRTSRIAKKYSELELQFAKTAMLAGMYGGWFLSTAVTTVKSGGSLLQLWSGWQSLPVWILLVYAAVGPGAIADLLQQQGQKEVSASESNIILCTESIFAALCAFSLLGEVSSMKEVIGGFFIVIAAILASK
jgi:drug/metabolite transporter (DMT)-like permease